MKTLQLVGLVVAVCVVSVIAYAVTMEEKRVEEEGKFDEMINERRMERLEEEEQRKIKRRIKNEKRRLDAEKRKLESELEQKQKELEYEIHIKNLLEKKASQPQTKRKVRRFKWESPADARGRIWNIPKEETEEALLTAFLRVCMAEADGNTQDCVGIWQVVSNNRMRKCNRGRVRRITECYEDEHGETILSSFRRHQRRVMGYMKKQNRRSRWISQLNTDCDVPKYWPHSDDLWDARYGSKKCPQIVSDGHYLLKGELPPPRPGHRTKWLPGRPITWGGRCEKEGGACDDPIACERGLARVENLETLNAFWCRIGRRGCRTDPEPICVSLGKAKNNNYRINNDGTPIDFAVNKKKKSPNVNL